MLIEKYLNIIQEIFRRLEIKNEIKIVKNDCKIDKWIIIDDFFMIGISSNLTMTIYTIEDFDDPDFFGPIYYLSNEDDLFVIDVLNSFRLCLLGYVKSENTPNAYQNSKLVIEKCKKILKSIYNQ